MGILKAHGLVPTSTSKCRKVSFVVSEAEPENVTDENVAEEKVEDGQDDSMDILPESIINETISEHEEQVLKDDLLVNLSVQEVATMDLSQLVQAQLKLQNVMQVVTARMQELLDK